MDWLLTVAGLSQTASQGDRTESTRHSGRGRAEIQRSNSPTAPAASRLY